MGAGAQVSGQKFRTPEENFDLTHIFPGSWLQTIREVTPNYKQTVAYRWGLFINGCRKNILKNLFGAVHFPCSAQ